MLFVLLLFCFEKVASQDTLFYSGGAVKETGLLDTGGKRTGEWKYYLDSGELLYLQNFKQDVLHGDWKSYDGKMLTVTGKYVNGKKEGEWNYYHYGQLTQVEYYDRGLACGEWRTYYWPGGNLNVSEHYESGRLNGEQKIYRLEGLLYSSGVYVHNNKAGEWKEFRENGQLSELTKYNNTNYTMMERQWYYRGKIAKIETYKHGGLVILTQKFYEDGQLHESGTCQWKRGAHEANEHCKPTGKWRTYYEDGRAKDVGRYNHAGERRGVWKSYHRNGRLAERVRYTKYGGTLREKMYNDQGKRIRQDD